jgi:hypothetical protein
MYIVIIYCEPVGQKPPQIAICDKRTTAVRLDNDHVSYFVRMKGFDGSDGSKIVACIQSLEIVISSIG